MEKLRVGIYRDTATRELEVEDRADKNSPNYDNIVFLHFPRDLLIKYFNEYELKDGYKLDESNIEGFVEDCICEDFEDMIEWLPKEDKEKVRKELIEYLKEV